MSANALDTLWLEERKVTDLIKQPVIRGVLAVLLAFAVFMGLWWIFMDPRGVLRWYTPQYGYMYIRWLLIVAIWQVYIFNFWPFKLEWMEKSHPVKKGLILIAINFAVTGLLVWVFYYNIFGRLSIPYFSWPELHKTGLSDFFSREYSSLAILMMAAIASWLSPIWPSAFENYPWHNLKQPAKGLTVFAVTFLLTTYAYLIFMHPHYRVLFYPWQEYTAAFPWWYDSFRTLSGNFNVGWIMCATVSVWLTETILDRYPFRLVKTQPWRGIAGFTFILLLAFILFFTFVLFQDAVWGVSVEGAKRIMAPDWRYLHTGELAVIVLTVAMILYFYFDNWPRRFSVEVNLLIRVAITILGAFILHWAYYAVSPQLLGTQPGYSHPQQFPMAPVILFINVMLYHNWFMDGWPGKRIKQDLKVA
jgi:AAT family amino acid transporter